MGDVVNLNRARKARARADRETIAAANRAKHGRPKAERRALEIEEERRERSLDGHARTENPQLGDAEVGGAVDLSPGEDRKA